MSARGRYRRARHTQNRIGGDQRRFDWEQQTHKDWTLSLFTPRVLFALQSKNNKTPEIECEHVYVSRPDQDLLEGVMADSCFHKSQHIVSPGAEKATTVWAWSAFRDGAKVKRDFFLQSGHLLSLAMVMLLDFQDRGFVRRDRASREDEELLQEVRDLEDSLHR